MKSLLCTAALLALASARPEMYKEKEDFQFSRSSTDEGHKSGFYGAQRGNMGGNYEKAHNMDYLAQHQMSSAVKQVEGELGDGSNTRTGSVFTAANSRGIYGSGRYDLSNVQGRNFEEGVSFGDSQSSSLTSHNSAYTGHLSTHNSEFSNRQLQDSRYAGYQGSKSTGHTLQSGNLQTADALHTSGAYGRQNGYQSGYQTGYQSGYDSQGYYHGNGYDVSVSPTNTQSRVIYTTPVRVVGRPGSRVAIPIGVQTYDATHSASLVDQNAINTDAEVFSNTDRQTNYRPTTNAKHYESAYSYRKQWEKHDTKPEIIPLPIPTVNPYLQNSELYGDTQLHTSGSHHDAGLQSHSSHSTNTHSAFNANLNSASSTQSRYQSGYNAQHNTAAANSAYTNGAYNSGSAADSTNVLGIGDSKPKSYQSSYSYHKSWERQGDPYVIKPVGGLYTDQTSQRLTDLSNSHAFSQHHSGAQYGQAQSYYHGSDCDENGHVRVARSYNTNAYQQREDFGQQSQNLENFGQHSQKLEDFGQQSQKLEDFGQQSQKFEDLGQQSQKMEDFGQQSQNLQDFGQESQNLQDFGQETQQLNKWDDLKDLGQQTQATWNNQAGRGYEKPEEFGQRSQNKWDNLGQQTQNGWDKLQAGQQTEPEVGQQTQDSWNKSDRPEKPEELEELGQQPQSEFGQQTQDSWRELDRPEKPAKLEDLGQRPQSTWDLEDLGQQVQSAWDSQRDKVQQNTSQDQAQTFGEQETQSNYDTLHSFNQYSQNAEKREDLGQQSQSEFGQQTQDSWRELDRPEKPAKLEDLGQKPQSTWDLEDLGQQVQGAWDSQRDKVQQNTSQNQSQTFSEQETQSNYDTLHSFNQYSQNTEKERKRNSQTNTNHRTIWEQNTNTEQQNNNWSQLSQTNDEDLGQQVQSSFGNFDILNKYKRNSTSDQVKPVWEQSEDDTQQASQTINAEEFGIHTKPESFSNNPWNFIHNTQHTDLSDQIQNDHRNDYWNMNGYRQNTENSNFNSNQNSQGGKSLQSLWDKINNMDQEYSLSSNKEGYDNGQFFTSGSTSSQTSSQSTSQQHSYHSESNSGFTETTHYQSQNVGSSWNANSPAYRPWKPHIFSENASPTTFTNFLVTSTTVKPEEDKITHNFNSRPLDIGRGDIGPEENVPAILTTTAKANTVQTKPNSPLYISNNKPYKTPEEIEALSLTTDTDKNINTNPQIHEINGNKHIQQADQTLSVLSIDQQKWLNEQREHGDKQYSNTDFTPKSVSHISHTLNEHDQSHRIHSHSEFEKVESNLNKYGVNHYPIKPVSESLYEPDAGKDDFGISNVEGPVEVEQNTEQKFEDFDHYGQQSGSLDQQSQRNLGQILNNFGQNNDNLDQQSQSSWGQTLQDFGQQNDKSEQKSETARDQEVQDFGQQVQRAWNPNENLQQQDTQQFETLGRVNQYQQDDFYNQRYAQSQQDRSQKNEDLRTPPEISKKVENMQATPENKDVEIITPAEPTEKPGFWKSVGSKFSTAKDKVASWFKS